MLAEWVGMCAVAARQGRKLRGGGGGSIQAQNFKYCLKIGPKIVVVLQKFSD